MKTRNFEYLKKALPAAVLILAGLTGCRDDIKHNDSDVIGGTDTVTETSGSKADQAGGELFAEISLTTGDLSSHLYQGEEVSLYGEYCDYSGKEIRSRRYGAVAVDSEGQVFRYQSVESMLWDMNARGKSTEDYRLIGIVDFISAKKLMNPEGLLYHYSRNLPSPGGSYVSAMDPEGNENLIFNIGEVYPGTRHTWNEIRKIINKEKSNS